MVSSLDEGFSLVKAGEVYWEAGFDIILVISCLLLRSHIFLKNKLDPCIIAMSCKRNYNWIFHTFDNLALYDYVFATYVISFHVRYTPYLWTGYVNISNSVLMTNIFPLDSARWCLTHLLCRLALVQIVLFNAIGVLLSEMTNFMDTRRIVHLQSHSIKCKS